MSILTLDPLGPTPSAPCAAPGFHDLRGNRRKIPCRALAWTGVIAGLALLGTTLPANAAPMRRGTRTTASSPPPAAFRPSRNPGRAGRGNPNNGGNFNNGNFNNRNFNNGNQNNGGNLNGSNLNNAMSNGTRGYYNGGSGSSGDPGGGADPGTGNGLPDNGNGLPDNGSAPGGNGLLRSGAIPGGRPSAPLAPPVKGTNNPLSHLDAALQDLLAAEQMMQASAKPDAAKVKVYLAIASQEIQAAGSKFGGKRHQAMVDIQNATARLSEVPANSQALGLTGDAINNVMSCLQMNP